jgi:hypothetical protein
MPTIQNAGSGYYNYYHVKGRVETKTNQAKTPWYDRDLSKEEISNNNSTLNRESEGADICRKIADQYRDVAEANRRKYNNVTDLTNAVYAKYHGQEYRGYSLDECHAMARNELNMTMYGVVNLYDASHDPHASGKASKNIAGSNEAADRTFNLKTLGMQIANVFRHNGINMSLFGDAKFAFSVNGMTKQLTVSLLQNNSNNSISGDLLEEMTEALNTGKNAGNLFHNMLHDASRQKLLKEDEKAKYLLYSSFREQTGLDIRDFRQTTNGFVNSNGENALDIYKEGVRNSSLRPEFKGLAYDYFKTLEINARQFDLANTADLTLSLTYQSGTVTMPSANPGSFEAFA